MKVDSNKDLKADYGLVSVLIPAYQAENSIKNMMDSLQAQTYENWEAVIINDGSTDRTGEILEKMAADDPRIHCYYQENAGVAAARGKALSLAHGDWTLMADADDRIPDNYLEVLLKKADQYHAGMALAGIRYCEEDGRVSRLILPPEGVGKPDFIHRRLVKLGRETTLACVVWNKLFKTEAIKDIQFVSDRKYEDIYVMHRMVDRFDKIAFAPEVQYDYIQQSASVMHTQKASDRLDVVEAYFRRALYYMETGAYSYMDHTLADAYYEYKRTLELRKNASYDEKEEEKWRKKNPEVCRRFLETLKTCRRESRIPHLINRACFMLKFPGLYDIGSLVKQKAKLSRNV